MMNEKQLKIEKSCSDFTSKLSLNLNKKLSYLAFCSPTSFRDVDYQKFWHPSYYNKNIIIKFFNEIWEINYSILSGVKKLIKKKFIQIKILNNNENIDILGITTDYLSEFKNNKLTSEYYSTDKINSINWVVINHNIKSDISRSEIFIIFIILLSKLFYVYYKSFKFFLPFLIELKWVLSFNWVNYYIANKKLSNIIENYNPSKIFSMHEMHPYSRLAWILAKNKKIKCSTLQHAVITREKLWYFPSKNELDAGLVCPDEFYVFSNSTKNLLKPFYPKNINFFL